MSLPTPSVEEVLAWPVTVDVRTAGRAWGMGRDQAYKLAREGRFPVPSCAWAAHSASPEPPSLTPWASTSELDTSRPSGTRRIATAKSQAVSKFDATTSDAVAVR